MEASPLLEPAETLLIVDDEPLMTDLFNQFMTRRGYRVLTAQDGPTALSILHTERENVALVITDMSLPQMDGIDISNAIAEFLPDTPVLIATGHDQASALSRLPGNVVAVIQKPYQNRELASRIQEILHTRRSHEQSSAAGL